MAVLEFLRTHPAIGSRDVIAALPSYSPGNIRQWLWRLCAQGVVARHFGRYTLGTVRRGRVDQVDRVDHSRREPLAFTLAVRGNGLEMCVTVRDKETLDDVLRGLEILLSHRLSQGEEERLGLVQARLLAAVFE